jgi:hypothetical protein
MFSEGIVHLLLGNNTAHVLATAMANQLALTMRLNEESASQYCRASQVLISRATTAWTR